VTPPWDFGAATARLRTAFRPRCESGVKPLHSKALRAFSWFLGARQPTGTSDCFENDCAVGGADIAFYVGETGCTFATQCMRHPEISDGRSTIEA